MCDYSLQSVRSRAAKLEDVLTVQNFGTGTKGFSSVDDPTAAVCVLPGTELAFEQPIASTFLPLTDKTGATYAPCHTARFTQTNLDCPHAHHDQLLLSDGRVVLLTHLADGQVARILQLPPVPKTAREAKEQRRVEYAG